MIRVLRRLFGTTDGSAAIEAAIFIPIFLLLTLGITDFGSAMYVRMRVNAATQAGAAYAIIHKCAESCLDNIKAVMNEAAGDPSFCSTECTASFGSCVADASTTCVIVSTSYTFSPFLPNAAYPWGQSATVSYTATVRII